MNTQHTSAKPWLLYSGHVLFAALGLGIVAVISRIIAHDSYYWNSAASAYRNLAVAGIIGIVIRDGFTLGVLFLIDHLKKRPQSNFLVMSLIPSVIGSLMLGLAHLGSVGAFTSVYGGNGEGGIAPFIYTVFAGLFVCMAQFIIIIISLSTKRQSAGTKYPSQKPASI